MAIEHGSSGLAGRYASALFELADERKSLDEVARDLITVKAMIAESADLRRLLRSPVVGRAAQGEAMQALLTAAGISDVTRNFIGVVASNRRLFALGAMIDAFLGELARRRGEIAAEVWSATPLTQGQLDAVTDTLRRAVGLKVQVRPMVDPTILGGLMVRVGSRLVDASVRSKLLRLQSQMKAPVLGG